MTEVAIPNEVIEQKKAQWASMGVVVHKAELNLQAQAQSAINSIKIPKSIDDVSEAEAKLKELSTVEG